MKLNKFLTVLVALLTLCGMQAKAEVSTDKVSIQSAEITAGEEFDLPISLVNDSTYKAFQMEIVLPQGITPVYEDDELAIEPTSRMHKNHGFTEEYRAGENILGLVCVSLKANPIKGNEGELFSVKLKAADDLQPGTYEIKLTGIKFTTVANNGFELADATATFTIPGSVPPVVEKYTYQFVSDGVVLSSGELAAGETLTAPTVEKEGYTFKGWNPEFTGKMPANNVVYQAVFEKIVAEKYTYQFVSDGVVLSSGELAAGETLTAPVAEKEGYTFKGWDPEFTGTMPSNNIVYQAVFEQISVGENHVSIQSAEIAAGAEFDLPISLVNDSTYKAFQMEIVLPQGITPVYEDDELVIEPTSRMHKNHGFTDEYRAGENILGLVCVSLKANPIKGNEGELFSVKLKAADDLQPGTYEIKLTGVKFTTVANNGFAFADATATFTIPGSVPPVVEKYTYQFVSDGVVLSSGELAAGETLTAPVAEKEGYTFKGWDPEFTGTMPSNNIVYQAVFEQISVGENHVSIQSAEIAAGAEFDLPISLVNDSTYKAFQMEIVLPQGITPVYEDDELVIEPTSRMHKNHSFTDEYRAGENILGLVCVSLKANDFKGNEGELFSVKLKAADDLQPGTYEIKLTGVKFTTVANNGFAFADATATFTIPAPVVEKFTYQFVSDGNVLSSGELAEGDSLAAPVAEKIGYTFNGWTPEFAGTMPAENVTYEAQWTVNQYTMTFVLGNGENDVVKNLDYGTAIEAPVPAKLGHTFIGWDPVPATVPADSMTFTAQWKRNSYKFAVTIDGVAVSTDSVLYGDTLRVPANPTKEGYTFTGWDPVIPKVMPANDLEVKAVFEINKYWVTFIIDGKETKSQMEYGAAIVAPETPEIEGMRFMKWAPALDADATVPARDVTYEAIYALVVVDTVYVEVHDTVRVEVEVSTLQQVDAPFIDVDKDGKIVLSCHQKDAQIYYTTDGTDPAEASQLYSEPFEVPANATEIKAIAVLRSKVATRDVTGIKNIRMNAANGKVYNLQGRQVSKVSRGVFIQDGKKVVVK